ncbi:type II toxin-antitoxin system HipA family toxin [Cryobacterium sp. Hh38]|nr:type II toxin-antitoxin system HipA family toxin [Cryobacterium sp. Hh38]
MGQRLLAWLDHPDRIVRVSSGYSPRRHLGLQLFRRLCAGRQPARFDSDWHEPHGRPHSTHILKPQLQSRPGGIYNEFYSHELARHMGLSQFSSEVITLGQTTFLAIERFDRLVSGRNVTLVHQDDVTQALGLDWRDSDVKFQEARSPMNQNRPSALRIAELTGTFRESATATTQWLRQLVFHVLIGNKDAHAKNVGLIHDSDGTSISQIYDAVPNLFQRGRINWDLAMAIDNVFDHRKITVERLVNEAQSWSVLRRDVIESTIYSTIHRFQEAQSALTAPAGIDPGVVDGLSWNAARLAAGTEISRPKER